MSHFLVGLSVHWLVGRAVGLFVHHLFYRIFIAFLCLEIVEKKLGGVNSCFKCCFEIKLFVCLSACLTFFESADARDLGLMTLFFD